MTAACETANVPRSQSVVTTVLSLALMGSNCSDYLTEAWRNHQSGSAALDR